MFFKPTAEQILEGQNLDLLHKLIEIEKQRQARLQYELSRSDHILNRALNKLLEL